MVDINDATISKLMNHTKLEQSVTPDLRALRLRLRDLVDLEGLGEVLQTRRAIVHEIGNLETCFVFGLFLVQGELEIAES